MRSSNRYTQIVLVLGGVLFALALVACSGGDGPTAPSNPVASVSDTGSAPQSNAASDESEVEDVDSDLDSDESDSDSDSDSDDVDSDEDTDEDTDTDETDD